MNCQELTELLDDGDLRNLPDAKRRELDTHLSGCADCAAEWRVQERIAMTSTLVMPVDFVARCRQLVAAHVTRLLVPRRVVLYGTVLLVAAAAALLVWRMRTLPPRPVPVAPVVAVAAAPVAAPPAHASPQIQPAPAPAPQPDKSQAPPPPANTFTVAVRPLQIEGDDVEGNARAERFRNRVMTLLPGVPGLVLMDAQPGTDTAAADFELRMKYRDSGHPTLRIVQLEIKKPAEFVATEAAIAAEATMSPADRQRSELARGLADAQKRRVEMRDGNMGLSLLLRQSPTEAIIDDPAPMQGDRLEYAAQQLVGMLRVKVFPLDSAYEQQQLLTLGNPGQGNAARLRALSILLSYAERRGGFSQMSPAEVRAGGEFALTYRSTDAIERPMVWDGMALTASPELVPYLIRGLDEVPQTETRLQLIKILAQKYGDDPRARAALAAAAKSNDQQTVRMAALRESGDPQWSTYVIAALMDNTLPDLQRLQPIADMAPGDMGKLSTSPKSKLVLEDRQLREFETVIIRAASDSKAEETVKKALFAAGAMDTPAALDMLIEILHNIHTEDVPPDSRRVSIMSARDTASNLILWRYPCDPKARAVIAELSSSADRPPVIALQALLSARTAGLEKSCQDQQPAQ